jgi:hypothetical protein
MNCVVTLEEDEFGYLILPLPDDLIRSMGWQEGDNLIWHDNGDGTFNLSRKVIKDKHA